MINTTTISPSIIAQIDNIDYHTGEILTQSQIEDDLTDPEFYIYRVNNWSKRLEEALDHAEALSSGRCIPSGYIRYYLCGFGLIHWLRTLYSDTWVDRAIALVLCNAPLTSHKARLAELQDILVEYVQMDTYDPRCIVAPIYRGSKSKRTQIANILSDGKIQDRNIPATAWMVAYLLDCYAGVGNNQFYRSLDQIMADAPVHVGLKNKMDVSRTIGRITDGWSDDIPKVPIFICSRKGARGYASEYTINPEYLHLIT